MEERELGQTGLTVGRLGFGCGAVGGLMVRGDPAEQRRAIGLALDAGVNYFDTAPSYGDGRSEENLGLALASLDAGGRAVVGTKVRLSADELADPAGPAAAIRRSLEQSLRRLGRERVDLLQLHNPIHQAATSGDPGAVDLQRALGEITDGLRRTVEEGLAGHVGFTGAGETEALHRVLEEGSFETVQAYSNAINPSAVWPGASSGEQDFDGLVGRAAERRVGVINIRVYAAGALAGDVVKHPAAGALRGAGAACRRARPRERARAGAAARARRARHLHGARRTVQPRALGGGPPLGGARPPAGRRGEPRAGAGPAMTKPPGSGEKRTPRGASSLTLPQHMAKISAQSR
jgi:aryl-alcohol dehydrogenase-like predicted oxidoreductase